MFIAAFNFRANCVFRRPDWREAFWNIVAEHGEPAAKAAQALLRAAVSTPVAQLDDVSSPAWMNITDASKVYIPSHAFDFINCNSDFLQPFLFRLQRIMEYAAVVGAVAVAEIMVAEGLFVCLPSI